MTEIPQWPRPLAGDLVGGSPVHPDTSSVASAEMGMLPAGIEIRTRKHRYAIGWSEIGDLKLEGTSEYQRKVSMGAVALLGPVGFAFQRKTASSVLAVTETSGAHHALITPQLLAAAQGALGQAFHLATRHLVPASQPVGSPSVADQMVRDGLLTPQEFEALKARLLHG